MDRVIERGCCPTELAADGRLRYPSVLVVRHDAQHLAVTVLLDLVVKIISVVAIADLFHGTERSERTAPDILDVDDEIRIGRKRGISELLNEVRVPFRQVNKTGSPSVVDGRLLVVRLVCHLAHGQSPS